MSACFLYGSSCCLSLKALKCLLVLVQGMKCGHQPLVVMIESYACHTFLYQKGQTALMSAAACHDKTGTECCKILLKHGADVSQADEVCHITSGFEIIVR